MTNLTREQILNSSSIFWGIVDKTEVTDDQLKKILINTLQNEMDRLKKAPTKEGVYLYAKTRLGLAKKQIKEMYLLVEEICKYWYKTEVFEALPWD